MTARYFFSASNDVRHIDPAGTDFHSLEAAIDGAVEWGKRLAVEGQEIGEDRGSWTVEISDERSQVLWRMSVRDILSARS